VSQVSYSGQQTTTVRNSSGDLVTTGSQWWGDNHGGTADYSETYTDTWHTWVTQPTYTYDHSWVIDSGSTTHDEYAGHEEVTVTYDGGTSSSNYCSGGDANGSKQDWYQLTGHWTEGNWVQGSGSGSGYWDYASGDDSSASNFSDYDSYDVPGYSTEFYGGWYYPGNYSQGCRGDYDYSLDMGSSVFSAFNGVEAEWSLIDAWSPCRTLRACASGTAALRPLKKLEWLDLCGTSTTEAGIKKFVQTMPRLVVHWREPSEDGGDDGEEKFFSAPRPGPWATSTPRPERPSSQTSVRPSESQRAASRRRSSARPWGVMGLGQSPY